MSFKLYLHGTFTPVEWSQAAWRLEGASVPTHDCAHKFVHHLMLEHLPRDGVIVDAGCGSGKWPLYLGGLGYRVVGIDVCHEALALARAAGPALDLALGDLLKIPLRTRSVDAVLSLGVVEHDERGPEELLAETHRILKPGGVLILSVPYDNLLRRLVVNRLHARLTRRRRRAGWTTCFAEYRFREPEIRAALERAGFEVLASHPDDYDPPYAEGLWVDYQNLVFDPTCPPAPGDLFRLPGLKGRVATALLRLAPWTFCGEVALVARAR